MSPWHMAAGDFGLHQVLGLAIWFSSSAALFLGAMMSSFSPLMRKAVLDWVCGGATPTRPAERWMGLTDSNGSELTIAGYERLTASFDASTNNSCSMLSVQTFGMTHSSDFVVCSLRFFDASSGGNELLAGALQTPLTVQANGGCLGVRDLGISLS